MLNIYKRMNIQDVNSFQQDTAKVELSETVLDLYPTNASTGSYYVEWKVDMKVEIAVIYSFK